ncbi:hypothetical protein Zmor_006319 [Zophobas morio]|uniref:Uncharacterized protein n=1 Tax=Zophobas morio TaxID=2755281 RepID=A0AA38IX94_9CUCU|nr:hypothetical protein Zmor_006319 [Zophobas morio]
MQIHKLLQACGGRSFFLVTVVNRSTTKVPLRRCSISRVWATGLELFSPHDGDSIYRKAYPTRISPLRTCPAELGHDGRPTRKRSRLLGQVEKFTTSAAAPESIQTCGLIQVTRKISSARLGTEPCFCHVFCVI